MPLAPLKDVNRRRIRKISIHDAEEKNCLQEEELAGTRKDWGVISCLNSLLRAVPDGTYSMVFPYCYRETRTA